VEVEIEVNPSPVADAGADQVAYPGSTIILDGSASSDPGGGVLVFDWKQMGGQSVSFSSGLSVTTFTAPYPSDVLTFTLTVTEPCGLIDTAIAVVKVPNVAPATDAGPDQSICSGCRVTLDGGDSSDPNHDALAYQWTQTGGPAVAFAQDVGVTTFTAPGGPGVLTFSLIVTDVHGLADATPDEVVVVVRRQRHFADANCDCEVDVADVTAVASRWRCAFGEECYETLYDLNGNGVIDVVDMMTVVSYWGWNCDGEAYPRFRK
jgi:hypothetical protein